jgi:Flp pilus assembly protein TadD
LTQSADLAASADEAPSLSRARAWETGGRLDLALAECDRLVAADGAVAEAWFAKGVLHQDRGEFRLAQAAYARSLALESEQAWVHFRLGLMAASLGQRFEALRRFRTAAALGPAEDEIRINLGAALVNLGWWDEAVRVLAPMGDHLPGWWASTRDTAMTALARSRSAIRERLRRHGAARTLSQTDLLALAQDLAATGRLATGLALSRQLMRQAPDDLGAFEAYASALARRDGAVRAAAFLDGLAWLFDERADYHSLRGVWLYEAGDFERALHAHDLARAIAGAEPDARPRTRLLFAAARWRELLVHCRDWMERSDDTSVFSYALGALRELGALPMFVEDDAAQAPPPGLAIVQFWDADEPPADVAAAMGSWAEANPQFRHQVFSASRARSFVAAQHGARAAAAFDACHHPAMKSDFFRVAYLVTHGGIYVDADDRCVRPVAPLAAALTSNVFAACASADAAPYVLNGFLAARPQTRVMIAALEEMVRGIEVSVRAGRRADIWHATGPGLITRALARAMTDPSQPAEPIVLLSLRHYRSFAATDESMAYKSTAAGNWRLAGAG